ncbi:MAG: hypothetical protein K5931_10550, partial [Lachnospiraceae bacterium]|nr:hypothetical protein [Lachnospiraceae bacterium]
MVKNINIISKRCLLSAFKTVLLLLFILIFWASERAFAAEYELVDGWEDAATRTIPEGSSKVSFTVTNTEYGFYKFKCPYCYNGGSHICYCEVDIPPRTAVVVINDLTNGNVIKRTGGDVDLDPSHKYKIQTFMNFEYGYALCKGFGDDDPNHCKGCGAKMPKYANITTSLKVYKFKAARFTSHPVNTTVYEGNSAAFSAAASDAKSYQWQVNENGNFYDIADGNGSGGLYYYGTNTPNLNISGCSIGHNNKGYRCIATGYSGDRAESQTGILFVKAKATPTPVVTRPVSPSPSPTVTPTSKPSPTVTPTSKPSPTVTPTSKPSPTVTPTSKPSPTVTPTSKPSPTVSPTSKPSPTATPTSKPSPTATPTSKPSPTATPTSRPIPTATPTSRPIPTATPTSSPIPTSFPSWETGTDPTGIPAREVTPVPEDRPVIIITPTPKPSYSPTETVSSEAEKEKDEEDEDKEFKEYDPLFEGLIDDYEEDTEEADQGGSDQ